MAEHHPGRLKAGPGREGFTRRDGRKFGFPVGIAFLILGSVIAWRGSTAAAYAVWGAGALLIAGALAIPSRLGPIYRAWMGLALLLSKVTAPIFLAVVYFVVLMPAGVVRRTFGSNPLRRKPGDSYWMPRETKGSDLRRQF